MRSFLQYRLLIFTSVAALLGIGALVSHVARRIGWSQIAPEEVPEPVLECLERHAGPQMVFVQVDRRDWPQENTYCVRVRRPGNEAVRLCIAGDGTLLPPKSDR